MARTARFLVVLLLSLGVLAGTSFLVLQRTTRDWFERDLRLRAELAAHGVRPMLVERWEQGPEPLAELLGNISRDERIMSAALCSADLRPLAATPGYPNALSCAGLAPHVFPSRGRLASYGSITTLPGGDTFVSAAPVVAEERALGFLVLVQDLSHVTRRDAQPRNVLLLAFGLLALAASAITVGAVRFAWRGWSRELRGVLRGTTHRPEFLPILGEVRDLVDRLARDVEAERFAPS